MSITTGPAAAMVAASGFIWAMNGQIVVAKPTVAIEPVARNKKSRFVTEGLHGLSKPSRNSSSCSASPTTSGSGIPTKAPDEVCAASCVSAPRALSNRPVRFQAGRPRPREAVRYDPSGVEIDALRDALGERQKQGFASVDRRDLQNVAGAVVHERHDPAVGVPATSTASSPIRSS